MSFAGRKFRSPPPDPPRHHIEKDDPVAEELLGRASSWPPSLDALEVSQRAQRLPVHSQQIFIFRMCSLLQTLVAEVEVERERVLDAHVALTDGHRTACARRWTARQPRSLQTGLERSTPRSKPP